MQKLCPRCETPKPLSAFNRRAASPGGYAAACRACVNLQKVVRYWADPAERAGAIARAGSSKQARFERDPAYKRAFNLWGTTKRRTRLLPWTTIADFLPICRKAVKAGPKYVIDHIVPLKHPEVCGLHVPWNLRVVLKATNLRKGSTWTRT